MCQLPVLARKRLRNVKSEEELAETEPQFLHFRLEHKNCMSAENQHQIIIDGECYTEAEVKPRQGAVQVNVLYIFRCLHQF